MADTNDQPMTDATTNTTDDPSAYLSSLSEPLKSYALKAFSPPEDTAATGDDTTTNKRLDELEISTRSHLLTLVEQLHSITNDNNNSDEQAISSAIETILDYLNNVTLLCLHITRHHTSTTTTQYYKQLTNISIIKKLPFLLLEDTIDSLPLNHIQTIWSSPSHPSKTISSLTTSHKLTSPHIFTPPSKLILLRICNKILKLLSNSNVDSEFAGTIMILLTKVFPLSERSAINVLGSFNVGNETVFENEVEFHEKHCGADGKCVEGDCENNKGDGNKGGSNNIGYDFYKTFWGVQHIFTDPTTTILYSKNNGFSQSDAANAYNCFMKDITSILVALEGSSIPVSKSSIEEDNTLTTTTTTTDEETTVRHHKYLTSSQLLHLQLKDVQLRIHFLTQLLIILSYLSSPTVTLPTGVVATVGSNTEKLSSQIKVAQMKQLSLIEKRAMVLLQSTTPPVGENMLKCLKWILKEREIIWRNWKRFKCNPALDKVGSVLGSSGLDVKNKLLVGNKRKAAAALEEEKSKDKKKKDDDAIQITDLAQEDTSSSSLPPTLKTFLEPYTDALDPENGIEGEYHPRNDSVYSWCALRLMARDQNDSGQLNKFDKIRRKDGDFEGMVRDMAKEKGDTIGGTLPEDYYAEEPDDDAPDEKKRDVDMDDAASVGTPEEETIAKKEQMEEFERAAMECEDDLLNDKDDNKEKGVEVKSGEKAEPPKKEDSGVKKEEKDDKKSKEKGNTATETASSKLNGQEKKKDEPKKSNVPEKKKEDAKKNESRKKKSPEKKDDDKKKKDEPKKGKEDNSKAKDNGRSKRGGGKSQSNEKDTKKDSKKDTKVDSNGKKTGRAKFTPPEGDKSKQKDEAIRNSSSRGRQSGNRRGSERNERQQQQQQPDRNDHGHRRDNSTDGRRSQIPAPSHNRSQSRDGRDNHRGNSSNDIGRETSRGRDAKSRSPPNDGGGRNAPRSAPQGSGRGGWQPPPQSQGRGAPQRGGRGGGRGRGNRR